MSYSLSSLKGGYIRGDVGDYYRDCSGGARSLDYTIWLIGVISLFAQSP